MATATQRLSLLITGDSTGAQKALKDTDTAMGRLGSAVTSAGAKMASALAAAGIAKFLKDSVEAAKAAEVEQKRLEAAVTATGTSWSKHATAVDKVIKKHMELSAFDDEDLAGALSTLTQTTGDVTKATELLGLATDISRGKQIDLNTAALLVGKVAQGNTGILQRYGIVIKEGATATEALGLLQGRYAGQAKAYGDSTSGAADKFNVALENLKETVGTRLIPAITPLLEQAASLLEKFNALPKPVQDNIIKFTAFGTAALLAAPYVDLLTTALKGAKTAAVALNTVKLSGVVASLGSVSSTAVILAAELGIVLATLQAIKRMKEDPEIGLRPVSTTVSPKTPANPTIDKWRSVENQYTPPKSLTRAQGGPIPDTGWYYAHEGEYVLQKSAVEALNKGILGGNMALNLIVDLGDAVARQVVKLTSSDVKNGTLQVRMGV